MKKIIFLLFMLNHAFGQRRVLFLVAGQSNAVGQGNERESVKCSSGTAFEYRFDGDSLMGLQDPFGCNELHFQKAHTGSAWPAFAETYSRLTGRKIVLVQAARGGSSCHSKAELPGDGTWDENGNLPLFENAVMKTKAAMKHTGLKLSAILWSQGERDANAINSNQLLATEYQEVLEKLIRRFREKLGKDLDFYIIETGYYLNHTEKGFDEVRKIQESITKKMKRVFIVYGNTSEFEKRGWMKDEIHYNQTALNDIGTVAAKKVVSMEK